MFSKIICAALDCGGTTPLVPGVSLTKKAPSLQKVERDQPTPGGAPSEATPVATPVAAAVAEKKAAAEKAAAEKAAAEKAAAEKAAAEQAAEEKVAADNATAEIAAAQQALEEHTVQVDQTAAVEEVVDASGVGIGRLVSHELTIEAAAEKAVTEQTATEEAAAETTAGLYGTHYGANYTRPPFAQKSPPNMGLRALFPPPEAKQHFFIFTPQVSSMVDAILEGEVDEKAAADKIASAIFRQISSSAKNMENLASFKAAEEKAGAEEESEKKSPTDEMACEILRQISVVVEQKSCGEEETGEKEATNEIAYEILRQISSSAKATDCFQIADTIAAFKAAEEKAKAAKMQEEANAEEAAAEAAKIAEEAEDVFLRQMSIAAEYIADEFLRQMSIDAPMTDCRQIADKIAALKVAEKKEAAEKQAAEKAAAEEAAAEKAAAEEAAAEKAAAEEAAAEKAAAEKENRTADNAAAERVVANCADNQEEHLAQASVQRQTSSQRTARRAAKLAMGSKNVSSRMQQSLRYLRKPSNVSTGYI